MALDSATTDGTERARRMATYEYIAKSASGEEVAGVLQADNEAGAVRTLDERRLFPVRLTERVPAAGGGARRRRVRPRDLGVAYGQLADLLTAGVPALRAIETLARATPVPALAAVLVSVRDDVAAGKTLADAMAVHPRVFTALHAAMVRAGERAGFLEDVLTNLSEFLERQDDLRSKIRGAMIYPLLLVVLGTVAVTGILVLLVPRFKPLFAGIALPGPTMVLFGISDLILQHWALLAALAALAAIGLRAFLRSAYGRRKWEQWRLKTPVFGRAVRMVGITRFCRILGTMLANGVPILSALAISKDAAGSQLLAESIERAAESVRAGEPLAAPLAESGLFPAEILEMIAVAEESNQLEKVLVQIADAVERRTNRQVDQAVRLIEPLILVLLAVTIGFVAAGLLYPIFTMGQTIK